MLNDYSPGAILPYISYMGMCHCEKHGFQAVYSGMGIPYTSVATPIYTAVWVIASVKGMGFRQFSLAWDRVCKLEYFSLEQAIIHRKRCHGINLQQGSLPGIV